MEDTEVQLRARMRKASALRRRMTELRLTEKGVADLLRLRSREAITLWRAGKTWPTPPTEETLERKLDLPFGFFERVGAGEEYRRLLTDGSPLHVTRVTLREVEALLTADPQREVGDNVEVLTMGDLQRALRAQVASLVRFAASKKRLRVGKRVILSNIERLSPSADEQGQRRPEASDHALKDNGTSEEENGI